VVFWVAEEVRRHFSEGQMKLAVGREVATAVGLLARLIFVEPPPQIVK